ncbi:MAG: pyrimidine dimer DNA glycosylase [Nitrospiraceae bacterium]|nr:pyrimidine dimer DNA glycosylase [Nitrospiraceae bacterium]
MRIWDIAPRRRRLCRNHLLGEHRELHAIWSVIVNGKKGYAHHPETLRWKDKLKALYGRHEALVVEKNDRGYRHRSPLAKRQATGSAKQTIYVDRPSKQIVILRNKGCQCDV